MMMSEKTIKHIEEILNNKSGKCFEWKNKKYTDRVLCECLYGHKWKPMLQSVLSGKWCPVCSYNRKRKTIADMHNLAAKQNGECLSDNYINAHTKLKWKCENNHIWETTPDKIQQKKWCPTCSHKIVGDKLRLSIEDMQLFAKKHGGNCISKVYINAHSSLVWQCAENHEWVASWNSIQSRNGWCPVCFQKIYLSQEKCRYIFEQLTEKRFSINRKILGNKTELDGYNDELKLAFEYNGKQHYKLVKMFHKSKKDFIKSKIRDKIKERICLEKGIKLIKIPYTVINKNNEVSFIVSELKRNKINIIENGFSYDNFWITNNYYMKKAKKIAENHKGKILSIYLGAYNKMLWECENGHQWKSLLNCILKGSWCPFCTKYRNRYNIEKMRELAKNKNGECLSKKYINNKTPLIWKCKKHHIWKASASAIIQGKWCQKCSHLKHSIEEMKQMAKKKNGNCLSNTYINNATKLKWKCSENHIWEARPGHILTGRWCPKCPKLKYKYDYDKIYELWKQGFTKKEISRQIQCSIGTIYRAIKQAKFV